MLTNHMSSNEDLSIFSGAPVSTSGTCQILFVSAVWLLSMQPLKAQLSRTQDIQTTATFKLILQHSNGILSQTAGQIVRKQMSLEALYKVFEERLKPKF